MKLKKNWFSFVIWAVLSVLSGTYLAVNVIYITASLGFHNNDTLIGFVCLSLVFCFAFYELLSALIRSVLNVGFLSDGLKKHIVRVLVILIFVGSYLYRFSHLSQTHFWLSNSDRLYSMAYYFDRPSMNFKSLIEVLYVDLLHITFTLFGKTTTIALLFQFCLEQLDLILFYFLVKKISSRGTGCFFLFLASVLKCYNDGISELSIEPLLIFFMLFVLFTFAAFYEVCLKHYDHGVIAEFLFGLCGALCGAITALDVVGFIVTLTLLATLITETRLSDKKVTEGDQTLYERMPLYAIYFAVMAVAAFFLVLFLFQDDKSTMTISLHQYYERYFSDVHFGFYSIAYHENTVFGFLIGVLETMWFFVFLSVPYDFARFGTLLWLGISLIQYLHFNVHDYSMISSLFSLLLCVGGVYGIVYHQKHTLGYAGKKVIAFEDYHDSKEYRESKIEPEASANGDADWNQNFSDGRKTANESFESVLNNELVEEVEPVIAEGVADSGLSAMQIVLPVTENAKEKLSMKQDVTMETEDEDEDEILDASELPIDHVIKGAQDESESPSIQVEESEFPDNPMEKENVLDSPAVIKIPEAVNAPVSQVLHLQIDNLQQNGSSQKDIQPLKYLQRDVPELVTREEVPEKSEVAKIAQMTKPPVKQPKKRLQFTIEEIDNWDYDITDIPIDDDFDIK